VRCWIVTVGVGEDAAAGPTVEVCVWPTRSVGNGIEMNRQEAMAAAEGQVRALGVFAHGVDAVFKSVRDADWVGVSPVEPV
jgi:hypothetical protein